jgi:hypothetical protein
LIPNVLKVISYSLEYYGNEQLKTQFSQTQLLALLFKEQSLEPNSLVMGYAEMLFHGNHLKAVGYASRTFFELEKWYAIRTLPGCLKSNR